MQRRRLKVDGNLLIKSSNREQSACLEILPPEGECSKLNALSLENCNTRPGSAGKVKKAPFVNRANSAPRRTPTPTKQIILEAAKRKQNLEGPFNKCSSKEADSSKNQSHSGRNDVRRSEDGKVETGAKDKDDSSHGQNEDDESDDESDDDDEEEEDSSEDEPLKAPNELMIEFLDCVMNSDYDNGLKLCKMILLYEPENAEALNFKRLIEEKIAIDAGNDEESDDSNENNNDNSEDSNESDDSSDSDTEESTEEEEDDDDKDDGDNKNRDGKQNKDCKQNKL